MYKKEERWELRYEVPNEDGGWTKRVCYPRSKEQVSKNREKCHQYGYKIIGVNKLYPFSTEKNQHNFMLIANICANTLHDYWFKETTLPDGEFERLENLKAKCDEYFSLDLPVAWIPWEKWKEANDIAQMAVLHRQGICIANGRPDLVKYC